ncbi:phosphoglycerate mutase-like protein [Boletus coccyginus]|nr:phosphoglycerate mutase-like protein [Boletus coccyginus]
MPVQFRMYIVRHGETEWNKIRRLQGHLDVPLNETGLKQATLVAEALKDIPFVRAFCSDLQRASKTAECILQYHSDTVKLQLDESIRERYMGELQGEVAPSHKPAPSLETTPNFVARCLAWYSGSMMNYMTSMPEAGLPLEQPYNILVVSHGGWIMTLLSALQASGLVKCRRGVKIGRCLNTGVSIIEYLGVPTRRDGVLVGTLIQYSGIKHLIHEDLHLQEVNADVLEDREKKC